MAASSQFNIGKDVTLDIIGPNGPLRFPILTGFNPRQNVHPIDSLGLDGINRFEDVPAGWSGTLHLDRTDSSVDDFFATKEAAYFTGLGMSAVTITETINEVSGGITQYRYIGVSLRLDDAGQRAGNSKIPVTIGWRASRRVKVQ